MSEPEAEANPHLLVVKAHQQRRENEAEAELLRIRQADENARAKVLQLEILNDELNPHALIIARHAARKAAQEREAAEKAAEEAKKLEMKIARSRSRTDELARETAEKVLQKEKESNVLPELSGKLLVNEEKNTWTERLVVLKEPGVMPTISIYDGDEAQAAHLRLELGITGSCAVEDYVTSNSITATLTLRKVKARPHAFSIFISDKCWTMEASNAEEKAKWMETLQKYFEKHAPKPPPLPAKEGLSAPQTHSRNGSGSSISNLVNMTLKRTSAAPLAKPNVVEMYSSQEVLNPLQDEMLNVTFENKLFDD